MNARRHRSFGAVLVVIAGTWGQAVGSAPSPRVAHEFVSFRPEDRSPEPQLVPPEQNEPHRLPNAIPYRGRHLPAPAGDAAPRGDEPLLRPATPDAPDSPTSPLSPEPPEPARSDPPSSPLQEPTRSAAYEPDRLTGGDPALHYSATFQPSVAPFKRFDTKDSVTSDFLLRVRDHKLRRVRVGGRPRTSRELFFGSVVLLASAGAPVPIPSVAPDVRILRFETTPRHRARFFRDGADNYYVSVAGSGTVRLNYLMDARSSYFGGPLPSETPAAVEPARRPSVPAAVRREAETVLEQLGISSTDSLARILRLLTLHFRSFRAGVTQATPDRASLFRMLATGGVGACRHRAYAFVILMQTLGVPARFVTNEAHAFTEVWFPRSGWRRVDLGGLSPELIIHQGGDKVLHHPRQRDPLPRPKEYEQGYTRRAEDKGNGPRSAPPPDPTMDPGRDPSDPPPPPPDPPNPIEPPGPAEPPDAEPSKPSTGPGARAALTVRLTSVQRDVQRGESLTVSGRVESAPRVGAAGLRIEVYLTDLGTDHRTRLGVLLTSADGTFSARLPISGELAAGRYRLHAETGGNQHYDAASSAP